MLEELLNLLFSNKCILLQVSHQLLDNVEDISSHHTNNEFNERDRTKNRVPLRGANRSVHTPVHSMSSWIDRQHSSHLRSYTILQNANSYQHVYRQFSHRR